ncbi:MAG: TadE family protein [Planctomycetota bacterium]
MSGDQIGNPETWGTPRQRSARGHTPGKVGVCSLIPNPQQPTSRRRDGGAAMIEALLVLPIVMFILSLVVYFGLSMQDFQRTVMVDRYESWRGSSRAPGPSTGLNENAPTLELRETFFAGRDLRLTVEPTDFFPVEAHDDWQSAASGVDLGAGRLAGRYFQDLPRGRSMRFFVRQDWGVPLWEELFPGSTRHRHTVMDTQWRFVNQVLELGDNRWYDDRVAAYERIRPTSSQDTATPPPTLGPADSVREEFYADFDRRIDLLGPGNTIAQRLQEFYQVYPNYWGPEVEAQYQNGVPWR